MPVKKIFYQLLTFLLLSSTSHVNSDSLHSESHNIRGTHYYLLQNNWNGEYHQRGGQLGVGGYQRSPLVAYDKEALVQFDLRAYSGQVSNVSFHFRITSGFLNTAIDNKAELYEEDLADWNPNTVSYSTFNSGPFTSDPWGNFLGSTSVSPNFGWRSISGPQLKALVQRWIDNPNSNKGVVLTGNYHYWGYDINIDAFELSFDIDTDQDPPPKPDRGVADTFATYEDFYIFAADNVLIDSLAKTFGGNIGSNGDITIRSHVEHTGDIKAGGDIIFSDNNAVIHGDVRANGSIIEIIPDATTIDGDRKEGNDLAHIQIPAKTVDTGFAHVLVASGTSMVLNPGSYSHLEVKGNATLVLLEGEYHFQTFTTLENAKVVYRYDLWTDHTPSQQFPNEIHINVEEDLRFHHQTEFIFEEDLEDQYQFPIAIKYYTNQSSNLILGSPNFAQYGVFTAPNAHVVIQTFTNFSGAVFAKSVMVSTESRLCRPPLLSDMFTNLYNMAPAFSPYRLGYKIPIDPSLDNDINGEGDNKHKPKIYLYSSGHKDAKGLLSTDPNDWLLNGKDGAVKRDRGSPYITAIYNETNHQFDHSCRITLYPIYFVPNPNYTLFVDDTSPCSGLGCTGTNWDSAFHDLQTALDIAKLSGQSIKIAPGTYRPSRRSDAGDPRSVTFEIGVGTKLEAAEDTLPQEIVLSGDLENNDGVQWPPDASRLTDNAYHVVTLSGKDNRAIKLSGISIEAGVANGNSAMHSQGGGILNLRTRPNLDVVTIRRNIAKTRGGGVYSQGTIRGDQVLLIENQVQAGHGGGLYADGRGVHISRLAAIDNKAIGIQSNGGAIYSEQGFIDLESSGFANNLAGNNAGAVYFNNAGGALVNITSHHNRALIGVGGFQNAGDGDIKIVNSNLWQDFSGSRFAPLEYKELEGLFKVYYSNITEGHAGPGNVAVDPLFKNGGNVYGDDLVLGSLDDGLRLLPESPMIYHGTRDFSQIFPPDPNDSEDEGRQAPEYSALYIEYATNLNEMDAGAYKYFEPSKLADALWAYEDDGKLVHKGNVPILEDILLEQEINLYGASKHARILRFPAPDSMQDDELTFKLFSKDREANLLVTEPIIFTMYRVKDETGDIPSGYAYQSYVLNIENDKLELKGKTFIFTNNISLHGIEHAYTWPVFSQADGKLLVSMSLD